MEEKVVLVTGIGGNVGQGIARNIRALNYNIRIIGTNVIAFSAGNHFCNKVYEVPYAYDENYIEKIEEIIINEKVDLILPSTDYESYYLSISRNKLSSKVVTSSKETLSIYLDKYKTSLHHISNNILFAKSVLPSNYKKQFSECIVKPREGRGSRGLVINPENFLQFSDEEYLVQELHRGEEITTAFYVTAENKLHGFISLKRTLENGTTQECEVVTKYDKEIEEVLVKIISNSKIQGCANMQFIINDKQEIVPFEINCRISGTNSIRHNFGYQDVKYTLQEHLFNELIDEPKISKGKAVRVLLDIIYPDKNSELNSYIY